MARKVTEPEKKPANLSALQMRDAIPKLKRRIEELKAVSIGNWSEEIRRQLDALHTKVDATLSEIFPVGTIEHDKYRIREFYYSVTINMMGTPPSRWMEGYDRAIGNAIAELATIVGIFEEKLADLGSSPTARAASGMDGMNLHPKIRDAVGARFKAGLYADAITAGCLALKDLVQNLSGQFQLDGAPLMSTVFSANKPILSVVPFPYADKSDQSEQEGVMHLFIGAQLALRNPRAHKLREDDPQRAADFIGFLSLLAKIADEDARKV